MFRHPLIRTVAYESQLKADRATLHRRLATEIERRHPDSADENAALIAEHLESAGDLLGAYAWHMRAGNWSTNRDIVAAHTSLRRARDVADQLPEDTPTAWRCGLRHGHYCARAHFASAAAARDLASMNCATCAMRRAINARSRSA